MFIIKEIIAGANVVHSCNQQLSNLLNRTQILLDVIGQQHNMRLPILPGNKLPWAFSYCFEVPNSGSCRIPLEKTGIGPCVKTLLNPVQVLIINFKRKREKLHTEQSKYNENQNKKKGSMTF